MVPRNIGSTWTQTKVAYRRLRDPTILGRNENRLSAHKAQLGADKIQREWILEFLCVDHSQLFSRAFVSSISVVGLLFSLGGPQHSAREGPTCCSRTKQSCTGCTATRRRGTPLRCMSWTQLCSAQTFPVRSSHFRCKFGGHGERGTGEQGTKLGPD